MSQGESFADDLPAPVTQPIPVVGEVSSPVWTGRQLLVYVGLPIALGSLFIGGPLEQLLFGWFYFLLRTLPRISIDWPTAILGLVSAAVFVAGLHRTLRWFIRQISTPGVAPIDWSWRSTVVASLTLVLMFTAGTAMVGATHQFVWLLTGRAGRPGDEEAQSQRRFGLLTLAINDAREAARRTQARNELKMTGLAMQNVHDVHNFFPPGGTIDESGTLLHGWPIFLAYYSNYTSQGIDFSVPWNRPPNDRLYRCGLPEFINPSMPGPRFDDEGYGLSHIAGNVHVLPICEFKTQGRTRQNWEQAVRESKQAVSVTTITDGTSNTLMIGTAGEQFKPWGHPANLRDPALGLNRHPAGFGGPRHWRGCMFLMCDGSVKFLSDQTDSQIVKALGTPAGGEQVPLNVIDP